MADSTHTQKVYHPQGGDSMVVASGGQINVETGGKMAANGTQASAIVSLTDSTTGTPGDTIDDTTTSVKDDLASLAAKINAILAALRGVGIIVT